MSLRILALDIVQNLSALSAAGRVSEDGLRIDFRQPRLIRVISRPNVSPHYESRTQCVFLTKAFSDDVQEVLELLCDFDLIDANSPEQRIVETRLLVVSSGMERNEEKAKLRSVKDLHTTARLQYMTDEEDARVRQDQGDAMIRAGIFESWEVIRAYKVIQDVLDRPNV